VDRLGRNSRENVALEHKLRGNSATGEDQGDPRGRFLLPSVFLTYVYLRQELEGLYIVIACHTRRTVQGCTYRETDGRTDTSITLWLKATRSLDKRLATVRHKM
jgi:hypothetical protein